MRQPVTISENWNRSMVIDAGLCFDDGAMANFTTPARFIVGIVDDQIQVPFATYAHSLGSPQTFFTTHIAIQASHGICISVLVLVAFQWAGLQVLECYRPYAYQYYYEHHYQTHNSPSLYPLLLLLYLLEAFIYYSCIASVIHEIFSTLLPILNESICDCRRKRLICPRSSYRSNQLRNLAHLESRVHKFLH